VFVQWLMARAASAMAFRRMVVHPITERSTTSSFGWMERGRRGPTARVTLLLQGLHDIEYDYQDKRSDQRAKHQELGVPSTDQRV
jgi:hypothetical protein